MTNLQNAEDTQAAHPNTFEIPSREWREDIQAGDLVKLIFLSSVDGKTVGERMWVRVKATAARTHFAGTVDNNPIIGDEPGYDDLVVFGPEHIIDIIPSLELTMKGYKNGRSV